MKTLGGYGVLTIGKHEGGGRAASTSGGGGTMQPLQEEETARVSDQRPEVPD